MDTYTNGLLFYSFHPSRVDTIAAKRLYKQPPAHSRTWNINNWSICSASSDAGPGIQFKCGGWNTNISFHFCNYCLRSNKRISRACIEWYNFKTVKQDDRCKADRIRGYDRRGHSCHDSYSSCCSRDTEIGLACSL